MNPGTVRRSLHHLHAALSAALLATGLLLAFPDLRGRLVGGYGREILDVHLYAGWAYLAIPALALAAAARPLLRDLVRRLGPPDPVNWRKVHIVFSLAAGVLLAASGVVLWLDARLPPALADAFLAVHQWLSWALLASIPVHVIVARHKIAARTAEILGGGPELHHPIDPDDEGGRGSGAAPGG